MFRNRLVVGIVALVMGVSVVAFAVARWTAPTAKPEPSLEQVLQNMISADNAYRANQQQRANPITGAQGNQRRCGVCGTMAYRYATQCPGCGTQFAPNFGS